MNEHVCAFFSQKWRACQSVSERVRDPIDPLCGVSERVRCWSLVCSRFGAVFPSAFVCGVTCQCHLSHSNGFGAIFIYPWWLGLKFVCLFKQKSKHVPVTLHACPKTIFLLMLSPNCAYPRLQWVALKRRLDSWLQCVIAEYDVCLVLGAFFFCNGDPLRKKKGETRQMGCMQDFKIKQRSHATSSRMASPRTARREWRQRTRKRKNEGHGDGMGAAAHERKGKRSWWCC